MQHLLQQYTGRSKLHTACDFGYKYYRENGYFLRELLLREASIKRFDGMGLTYEQVTTLVEISSNSTCHKISHLSGETNFHVRHLSQTQH